MFHRLAGFVSVMLTAGGLLTVAYRAGRTHAAWHDVRAAKHAVRDSRRTARTHSARLAVGIALVLIGLVAAGINLSQ